MSARRTSRLIALAAAALLLTGCATGSRGEGTATTSEARAPLAELDLVENPRDFQGPSTALMPETDIEPLTDTAPAQDLPVTVESQKSDGSIEEFEITDTSRVVAMDLSGSIAANIWALGFGETIVGKDQSTTFAGTEDIPEVTQGGHNANVESIIALDPTLVLTDGTIGPRDVIEQLRDVGITVVFLENEPSFEGAENLARSIGEAYGAPEAGEQLAKRIGQQVEDKIAEIAEIAPQDPADRVRILFLYLRGNAGVYYLFGEESGADQLIQGLAAVDVAGELGWEGMKPMTDEAIVAANPDLILTMSGGIESVGGVDGLLQEKVAVAATRAGENRRVVDMDDGSILSFGPRSADVLDSLARAIYAPDAESAPAE